jgi:hypothetical protein
MGHVIARAAVDRAPTAEFGRQVAMILAGVPAIPAFRPEKPIFAAAASVLGVRIVEEAHRRASVPSEASRSSSVAAIRVRRPMRTIFSDPFAWSFRRRRVPMPSACAHSTKETSLGAGFAVF